MSSEPHINGASGSTGTDGQCSSSMAPAALPNELRTLVDSITRRTRLRRRERADVSRELTSHFDEALAAGKSVRQAVDSFGDPKEAARRLRHGAIAKRSPLDRALGQTLTWTARTIVVVFLAYAAFGIWLAFKQPVIRFDPVARFRAMLPTVTAPEHTAWPGMRDALVVMGCGADDPLRQSPGALAVGAAPYPGQEQWPAARAWLQAQRAPLASMREATRQPILGFPVGLPTSDADARLFGRDAAVAKSPDAQQLIDSFPMFDLRLPYLATLRTAARILAVDMLAAAEEVDGERATRDAEAAMALSAHAQEGRLLVGDLVGAAIRQMALQRMTAMLEWKRALFSDAQLARMQAAAMGVPDALQHVNLDTERLCFEDVVQRLYTDDGNGDGLFRPTVSQLGALGVLNGPQAVRPDGSRGMDDRLVSAASRVIAPAAAMYVAGRREMLELYETMISRYEQDAALPLRDMEHAKGIISDAELGRMMMHPSERIRWYLVAYMTPALGQLSHAFAIDRAQCLATATAFAAERYRRVHGAWPMDAASLVPDFMQSVPEDPWSGKPVLMSNDGDGFRIWSVGRDGVDDRGDLTRRIPTFVGQPEEALASTNPDVQVQEDHPNIDWVWFAPRGTLERWNYSRRPPP